MQTPVRLINCGPDYKDRKVVFELDDVHKGFPTLLGPFDDTPAKFGDSPTLPLFATEDVHPVAIENVQILASDFIHSDLGADGYCLMPVFATFVVLAKDDQECRTTMPQGVDFVRLYDGAYHVFAKQGECFINGLFLSEDALIANSTCLDFAGSEHKVSVYPGFVAMAYLFVSHYGNYDSTDVLPSFERVYSEAIEQRLRLAAFALAHEKQCEGKVDNYTGPKLYAAYASAALASDIGLDGYGSDFVKAQHPEMHRALTNFFLKNTPLVEETFGYGEEKAIIDLSEDPEQACDYIKQMYEQGLWQQLVKFGLEDLTTAKLPVLAQPGVSEEIITKARAIASIAVDPSRKPTDIVDAYQLHYVVLTESPDALFNALPDLDHISRFEFAQGFLYVNGELDDDRMHIAAIMHPDALLVDSMNIGLQNEQPRQCSIAFILMMFVASESLHVHPSRWWQHEDAIKQAYKDAKARQLLTAIDAEFLATYSGFKGENDPELVLYLALSRMCQCYPGGYDGNNAQWLAENDPAVIELLNTLYGESST